MRYSRVQDQFILLLLDGPQEGGGYISTLSNLRTTSLFGALRFECTELLGRGVPETNETMRYPHTYCTCYCNAWLYSVASGSNTRTPQFRFGVMISNRVDWEVSSRKEEGEKTRQSTLKVTFWHGVVAPTLIPHHVRSTPPAHLDVCVAMRSTNTNTWSVS